MNQQRLKIKTDYKSCSPELTLKQFIQYLVWFYYINGKTTISLLVANCVNLIASLSDNSHINFAQFMA